MSKFKVGDKVVCVDSSGDLASSNLLFGEEYTIREVESGPDYTYPLFKLVGVPGGYYSYTRFKSADTTQQKRTELKAALELVQSYGGGISYPGAYGCGTYFTDKVLPLESPQQKKLKELEKQQLEIVAKMEQLRSEL